MADKYDAWLENLPKDKNCYVRVKYRPQYHEGKEEVLSWIPECKVCGFLEKRR